MPDYEFYTASYLGEKIPQESFARFITRAARQLERYKSMFDVRPRAGLLEPEACALCAMADAMYAFAEEDKRCRVVKILSNFLLLRYLKKYFIIVLRN